jgi:hypothetical protein
MDASMKATILVRRDNNSGSDCFARLNLSAYTKLANLLPIAASARTATSVCSLPHREAWNYSSSSENRFV